MAGSCTILEDTHGTMKQIIFNFTSDATGNVTATTTAYYSGDVCSFATLPSAVAPPTVNYDIVIKDNHGFDVLFSTGYNKSASTGEYIDELYLGSVTHSQLYLKVSSAGNARQGSISVWLR